jgi:hypothetical protein
VAYHHVITPHNWAGLAAAIGCVIGAYLWTVLLFAWDLPEKTRYDRYRNILRTPFDIFKEAEKE